MNVVEFITAWNATWRSDYWWRKKYNVAFNSEQHRAMDPVDIQIDYMENQLVQQYMDQLEKEEQDKPLIEKGEWMKENEKISAAQDAWDNMDLSKF
jgi:hypothetical protein